MKNKIKVQKVNIAFYILFILSISILIFAISNKLFNLTELDLGFVIWINTVCLGMVGIIEIIKIRNNKGLSKIKASHTVLEILDNSNIERVKENSKKVIYSINSISNSKTNFMGIENYIDDLYKRKDKPSKIEESNIVIKFSDKFYKNGYFLNILSTSDDIFSYRVQDELFQQYENNILAALIITNFYLREIN